MEMRDSIVMRFEGSAGDGILSLGTIVAKTAARCGFHACTLSSFSAEVRGGQSTFQLHIGCQEVTSPGDAPALVVALNEQAVKNQLGSLTTPGLLLCPPGSESSRAGVTDVAVDYDAAAKATCGDTRNRNLIGGGVLIRLLGMDLETACSVVRDTFAKKGEAVVSATTGALRAGYALPLSEKVLSAGFALKSVSSPARLLLSGNEAVALGAVVAGVRFYAGYPITPASEIMEMLAKHLPEVGGRAVQAEDEIASLGMCIGAAFGGVKNLTATSGPGLSLMTELLGLAAMSELPVVVVNVQRSGPSTGMPTKDGQADLNLAVYGAHGDAPRIVLAPQSVSDCFNDTIAAVNLAHRFHIPVIVLSSQSLSHRLQTIELPELDSITVYEEPLYDPKASPDQPYKRYLATENGATSPRSVPGIENGMYRTGGLEHDEFGQPRFDDVQRNANVTRRRERMTAIQRYLANNKTAANSVLGKESFAFVSWGTTAGPAREALATLKTLEGLDVGCLFPRQLWPVPSKALSELIASGIKTLYVCEANDSQQFTKLICANCADELRVHGVEVVPITRDDGNPFTATDIVARLKQSLRERNQGMK
jgi:2-oxoglutarate ferredoxin oxidoreductase subunit alpha